MSLQTLLQHLLKHGEKRREIETTVGGLGVGNISLLSYIVILRAHDNRIVVVLKLSSYRVHIISGVIFAEIRHAVAK